MAMNARFLYCVIFVLICESGFAQFPGKDDDCSERRRKHVLYDQPGVDERTYEDSTGTYVVRFTYGMFDPYEPLGEEEGEIRYSALIEVFEIKNCSQVIIGHGFMGTYDPEGCIYDEAEYLISEARKIALRAERRKRRKQ